MVIVKKNNNGILVYIELVRNGQTAQNAMEQVSKQLIGEAYRLSKQYPQPIYGIAIGRDISSLKEELMGYPLTKVYFYKAEEEFQADIYEDGMLHCIETLNPSIVLIGGTQEGRALAPRIAVACKTGLTADCTKLEVTGENHLVQIRPAFGGNIMASILTENKRPQLATVRTNVMEEMEGNFDCTIEFVVLDLKNKKSTIKILGIEHQKQEDGITDQKLLVVAGRGVKKKEDLNMLFKLANHLGGKLASSRALVEKGWMKPEDQIGLSGNTVKPECMITCGVSGSIQFVSGMRNTKNIIAINSEPSAAILKIAHYPICGDFYEVIPEIFKKQGMDL